MVLALTLGLMAARPALEPAVCGAVRAAIDDLQTLDGSHADHRYLSRIDKGAAVFATCPSLASDLPPWLAVADARTPTPSHLPDTRDSEVIFTIEVVSISRDRRNATLDVDYTCTGLCGAGQTVRYRRDKSGWRRDGKPELRWVS